MVLTKIWMTITVFLMIKATWFFTCYNATLVLEMFCQLSIIPCDSIHFQFNWQDRTLGQRPIISSTFSIHFQFQLNNIIHCIFRSAAGRPLRVLWSVIYSLSQSVSQWSRLHTPDVKLPSAAKQFQLWCSSSNFYSSFEHAGHPTFYTDSMLVILR